MIRLRYQARHGYWWVDLFSIHRTRDQQRGVFRSGRYVRKHNAAFPRSAAGEPPPQLP